MNPRPWHPKEWKVCCCCSQNSIDNWGWEVKKRSSILRSRLEHVGKGFLSAFRVWAVHRKEVWAPSTQAWKRNHYRCLILDRERQAPSMNMRYVHWVGGGECFPPKSLAFDLVKLVSFNKKCENVWCTAVLWAMMLLSLLRCIWSS